MDRLETLKQIARGISISIVAIVMCLVGIYSVKWIASPSGPDLATASEMDLRKFMASDEFNKLFQWQRREYLQAYVDRQKNKSFGDLISTMMRNVGDRNGSRPFIKNLQQIEGREPIISQMADPMLDKFYAQDQAMRDRQLYMMAMFQQTAMAQRPELFGLPTAEQFKGEMVRVMSNQPSATQNKIAQFMLDIRSTRRQLNLPDPS